MTPVSWLRISKRNFGIKLLALLLGVAASNFGVASCVDVEDSPVSVWTRQLRDHNGKAIAGARVEVRNSTGKMVFVTKSDASGRFSIKRMPGEDYQVRLRANGFIEYKYHLATPAAGSKVFEVTLRQLSECRDMGPIEDDH